MDAQTLLDSLQQRGAVVTVEGPTLWVEPDEVLTDNDCDAIRELKPALLRILQATPAPTQPCRSFYPVDHYDPALAASGEAPDVRRRCRRCPTWNGMKV